MSAVASSEQNQANSLRDICRNVKDFDTYEELEVETAGASVIVLKKDRNNEHYPSRDRLIVNMKTRSHHHLKIGVSRYTWGGSKTREEISMQMNNKEFYFASIASKAEGMTSGDVEKITLDEEVRKAMKICCKWCGVGENEWTEFVLKLDIENEYARIFDYVANAEERARNLASEEAKRKAADEAKAKMETDLNEKPLEEKKPAKCPHNEVKCPHTLKKRCYSCRKKVGMNGLNCDCGYVFCSVHQTPLGANDDLQEGHLCEFDHNAKAQEKLYSIYSRALEE